MYDDHLNVGLLKEMRAYMSEQFKITYSRAKLLQDVYQAPHIKLFLIDGINYFLGVMADLDRKCLLQELYEQ
jgi:hypothetical protein